MMMKAVAFYFLGIFFIQRSLIEQLLLGCFLIHFTASAVVFSVASIRLLQNSEQNQAGAVKEGLREPLAHQVLRLQKQASISRILVS